MGLDSYIFRAKNKKVFEEPNWSSDPNLTTEVWYARKYWDLIQKLSFIESINDECGEFIQLSKENIEEMIQVATHTPDYWGKFDTVPALCEILYDFDEDEEEGWHYYFEFDY